MTSHEKVVSATLCFCLAACGAMVDSDALKAEGECTTVTPVPPLNNTAQLAPDAGTEGGGS